MRQQGKLNTICMADAEPRQMQWLWPGRIPSGKLVLIAGSPGLGKSMVTLDMTARVSRGRSWPDGKLCKKGHTVLLSAEDDIHDTIRPRLDVAGADVGNVTSLETVLYGQKYDREQPFRLTHELNLLKKLIIKQHDVELVVIDPVSAFMGSGDTHRESSVRNILYPLSRLASEHNIAVICVIHLRKTSAGDPSAAMDRIMGSVAFAGAARSVWGVAKDKEDPDQRIFVSIKQNLIEPPKAIRFSIDSSRSAPRIVWGEEFDGTADEIMAVQEVTADGKVDKAVEFLKESLAKGPKAVPNIKEEMVYVGIKFTTLERAKKKLGIVSEHGGCAWFWSLPS